MSTGYCEACGASLSEEAKFCRACGAARTVSAAAAPPTPRAAAPTAPPRPAFQAPLPPPAVPAGIAPTAPRAVNPTGRLGAVLAILGGLGMCFVTLYAIVYLPLHYDQPLNYGGSLQFGDLLALGSGLVAIGIGIHLLIGRPGSAAVRGVLLALAGMPTLVLAVLWAFPQASHFSVFPPPFYFGLVYFSDLGLAHTSSSVLSVPLVSACVAVIAAAIVVALPAAQANQTPHRR
jgi:zinc-ribbon domain